MAGYKHRQLTRLGCLFPQATVDRLESFAKKSELSMSEIVRFAVESYLDSAES